MHWRVKGTVQKILGLLPGGRQAHYHLQRHFGGLKNFAAEIEAKVSDWRIMAGHLDRAGLTIAGADLYEIGTGWYPTLPFACFIGGARRVTTVDLSRNIRHELVRDCVAHLELALPTITETLKLDPATARQRWQQLSVALAQNNDLAAATNGVVDYSAPADATRTGLAADSVDCVFSNSVLEHVPPAVIDAMYVEALRILKPGGIMFHSVNCGDHYAYVDRNVSQLNYLQFSDRDWERWNNKFLYQNRLRAHYFVERAQAQGFAIELNTARPHERRLRELAAIKVHPQFADLEPERLCITSVDFIARKTR